MRDYDSNTPKLPYTVSIEFEIREALKKYCHENSINISGLFNKWAREFLAKNNVEGFSKKK